MKSSKSRIGITIGDPAGIGPEIVVRAAVNHNLHSLADYVVIGDSKILEKAIDITGADLKIYKVADPDEGDYRPGILNIIDLNNVDMKSFRYGEVSGMCGLAAFQAIEKSVALARERKMDAVATAPIHKEALKAANIDYIGHTEIFAALTGSKDPVTMFEVRGMKVFFLSRHVSLREACDLVKKDRIKACVKRCFSELSKLGSGGTMAIAGLNPHSGEHGLFGREEVEEVIPAVKELREEGYPVTGPVSADSVFHLALQGRFHSVLSLTHDQGHIATKTLDFERTIAITCGLPFLRTSVDHGTAMDIAGKNLASEVSMAEAIRLAAKYAPRFQ